MGCVKGAVTSNLPEVKELVGGGPCSVLGREPMARPSERRRERSSRHGVGRSCPGAIHGSAPAFHLAPCLDAPEFAKTDVSERPPPRPRPRVPSAHPPPPLYLDQSEFDRI